MANRKLLSTVYPGISSSPDCTRLQPQVSGLDCRTIVSVSGDTTILSHICQLAIKTTAAYVRSHSLDFTTRDELTKFLSERSPFVTPPAESVTPDESRRVTSGGEQAPHVADKQSKSGKSVARGGGKEEGKGRKGSK